MDDQRNVETDGLTPDERAAQDAIRSLPGVHPDADFRARLKHEFQTGAIRSARPGTRPRWMWVCAAAAAAALLIIALFTVNAGPRWQIAQCTGEGVIEIRDQHAPAADARRLQGLLRAGARIRVSGGAQLDLICPGTMAFQVTSGSEVTLPPSPGRWFRRAVECEARAGEVRIVTGPVFHGARLRIAAPEAKIEVVGTTLAVIAGPDSTCLCVLEGVATMTGKDGLIAEIRGGERRTVFLAPRAPHAESILDMERMKLEMLREQFAPLLEGRPPASAVR